MITGCIKEYMGELNSAKKEHIVTFDILRTSGGLHSRDRVCVPRYFLLSCDAKVFLLLFPYGNFSLQ
jgi:hypothetical protein